MTAPADEVVGRASHARRLELNPRLYAYGAAFAMGCGVILADTKFEFGASTGR